ncbi:MAG: helix-turn-helix domain-containing protein [Acidimicrobiales bacterium]
MVRAHARGAAVPPEVTLPEDAGQKPGAERGSRRARWPVVLHRDGTSRRLSPDPGPSSVPELARVLRQARTALGLDFAAVSQQTGVSVDQLQDLEAGTVDRLADRVATLKALGRYARFLDLPGEHLVMVLVENWPTASVAPVVVVVDGTSALSTRHDLAVPESATVPLGVPALAEGISAPTGVLQARGLAPDSTAELSAAHRGGRHTSTIQVPSVLADTGVTRAIGAQAADGPLLVLLRSLVVILTVLVVLGTTWLVVNRYRPQWLADLHIPHTANQPIGDARAGAAAAATPPSTRPAHSHTASKHHAKVSMHLVSANASAATFSVGSPTFQVRISAGGGEAWVSASGPLSSNPQFEGVIQDGQSRVVTANHQLVVRVGSIAAHLAILVGTRTLGTYVPPAAPFTVTFTSS